MDNEQQQQKTLRDEFAVAALIGLLSAQDERSDGKGTGIYPTHAKAAIDAFKLADEMMKARNG